MSRLRSLFVASCLSPRSVAAFRSISNQLLRIVVKLRFVNQINASKTELLSLIHRSISTQIGSSDLFVRSLAHRFSFSINCSRSRSLFVSRWSRSKADQQKKHLCYNPKNQLCYSSSDILNGNINARNVLSRFEFEISPYGQCSTNSECGCFHMTAKDDRSFCGFLWATCSRLVPCEAPDNVCGNRIMFAFATLDAMIFRFAIRYRWLLQPYAHRFQVREQISDS